MSESSARSLIAVVDSNLFVSGMILKRGAPFALLEAWRAGAFVVLLSAKQNAELNDVFVRPKIRAQYHLSDREIAEFFHDLARLTRLVSLQLPLLIDVRDPKDEAILAAALGGNADYIVTGDNDLLTLAGDPRLGNVQIVTARTFLDLLP